MDVVVGLAAWAALLGGAILLRAKLSDLGLVIAVLGVTVLLAAALVGLALTDSPIFGWVAFGSVFLFAVGRFAADGFGALGDRD